MNKRLCNISLILNGFFILILIYWYWNAPSYKLGRLEKDLTIGYFLSDSILFSLPKGITVEDLSPRGLSRPGQFEPFRFGIIITSEEKDLVNYDLPKDSLNPLGSLLSADVKVRMK